jgi:Zn-dependent M16 (insulinase) family peptidase
VEEFVSVEIRELKPLYSVGDELSGFVVESVNYIEEYQGYGYFMRHRITNMEVYHLNTTDIVNFFAFVFKTPPVDDCGNPHIIEHSVLAGSKRYPVRDPFMALLKGSVNTFMNALTYPDYTIYPAASPLKKDFNNLFKVYADAVFAPLLREETFWQEGIRISLEDDQLGYDGVVFNEMLGELSDHDSVVARQSIRNLFGDTPYFYESGGLPEAIAKLNYQQFLGYYTSHYHGSNCRLFLYGDQDPKENLKILDELYLSDQFAQSGFGASQLSKSWSQPKTFTATSASESMEIFQNNASVTVSWATTLVDEPLEVLTLQILTDILLGNPGSPLYKAIIESNLAKDISQISGMDTSFRQMPFIVGFKGIDPKESEKALNVVLDTLKELVDKGIDKKLVVNAIKRQEFVLRELSGDIPTGFRAMNRALRGWLHEKHPEETIEVAPYLKKIKAKIKKESRYFENWIKENLLENNHRSLLTVKPDVKYHQDLEKSLQESLDHQKELLNEKEWETLKKNNERFIEFENRGDDVEALQTVPVLSKEDLPAKIRVIDQEHKKIGDIDFYVQNMQTNKIIYSDGFLKIENLTKDEIVLLQLLTRMIQLSGVKETPYDEMAVKVRDKTGGLYFFLENSSLLDEEKKNFLALGFRLKCLEEDYKSALSLLFDILNYANVDDTKRLKAVINDLVSDFESNVGQSAQLYASQRSSANFSPILYVNEIINGLEQWFFLNKIDVEDQSQLENLGKQLKDLQSKIVVKENLILHLCSEEGKGEKELVSFANKFSSKKGDDFKIELPFESFNAVEVFTLPSKVSYSAIACESEKPQDSLQTYQSLLTYILTTNHLWNQVRGIGGAYGVSAHIDMLETLALFASYRDPRINGTLDDFKAVLENVKDNGVEPEVIDQAIISFVGREIRPLFPKDAAMIAFRRALYNISDEFRATRRELMLTATSLQLKEAASKLLASLERKSSTVVIAGNSLVEKEALKNGLLNVGKVKLPL